MNEKIEVGTFAPTEFGTILNNYADSLQRLTGQMCLVRRTLEHRGTSPEVIGREVLACQESMDIGDFVSIASTLRQINALHANLQSEIVRCQIEKRYPSLANLKFADGSPKTGRETAKTRKTAKPAEKQE